MANKQNKRNFSLKNKLSIAKRNFTKSLEEDVKLLK